jgi:hypothetical protein
LRIFCPGRPAARRGQCGPARLCKIGFGEQPPTVQRIHKAIFLLLLPPPDIGKKTGEGVDAREKKLFFFEKEGKKLSKFISRRKVENDF